jgi:Rps23 Pro-64 3,4-dihydroxylase Tpa1-like proline 4-hydroxylase
MPPTSLQYFDPDYLNNLALSHHTEYITAKPFPHIVIDNFLPEPILDEILEEFPKPDSIDWQSFKVARERKLASKSELQMGEKTRFLLYQFNSGVFLNFLEQLTGIEGLLPDPYFGGGGLHQIERGGYLKVHTDFNRHTKLQLDRRLNLLVYLNKNWQEEYGGHLQLWDSEMTRCERAVLPIFNRCVIFNTTDFSYHGHPDPLNTPEGVTRRSLALYYYSNGRPAEELAGNGDHTTIFQARPGEKFQEEDSLVSSLKTFVKTKVFSRKD